MNLEEMRGLMAPAALLAKTADDPRVSLLRIIGKRPLFLAELAAAQTGLFLEDILEQPLAKTFSAIAEALPFMSFVRAAGPERVCSVLYRYNPHDVDSLILLLHAENEQRATTLYLAECMRLLVTSKLNKNAPPFPSLTEFLHPEEKPKDEASHVRAVFASVEKMFETFGGDKA